MIRNAKAIVKKNFVVATFDAMNHNYFNKRHEHAEALMNCAIDQKISLMSDDDIQTFALAIVDGYTVEFNVEKEDFFISL